MKTKHPNIVEFQVSGPYALFSDPIMRVGGEKCTYQIPTYESLKGIMMSVYWKPTIIWYIDKVRVMKPIQTEVKGVRPIKYNNGGNDLAFYTYLKDTYKEELVRDKYIYFLGTRECQGYVEPCVFGEGEGAYDHIAQLAFGVMYHGITYADEAYSEETKNRMTVNFWRPVMKNGVIEFLRPEECPIHKPEHEMPIKEFGKSVNFSGIDEFSGGDV